MEHFFKLHVESVLSHYLTTTMVELDRYIADFERTVKTTEVLINTSNMLLTHHKSTAERREKLTAELAEQKAELQVCQDMVKHLTTEKKIREALIDVMPKSFPVSTKLRICRAIDIGENEVQVDMVGKVARRSKWQREQMPANTIPVRFSVTNFGFTWASDFRTIVLPIPTYCVEEA